MKNGHIRPFIPIKIINPKTGVAHREFALLDSGADSCVFPHRVVQVLGIDIETGTQEQTGGIGGNMAVWHHEFNIEVLDPLHLDKTVFYLDKVVVGCSKEDEMPALLGTKGFLEKFIVTLNYQSKDIKIQDK